MLKAAEKRQKESEERGVKTQKMKNKLKTNASISAASTTTRGGVGLNEGEKRRAEGVVADWNS